MRFNIGFTLVLIGIFLTVAGFAVMYIDKIPLIARLPGDINIHGKGWSFHFPIVTCIILSIILTIILNIIFRR
ncbi:MAG TPA: DUF2905 domain-containing protein [bacterium]|nr:DUF2905 domain-containing protein [bacterium]